MTGEQENTGSMGTREMPSRQAGAEMPDAPGIPEMPDAPETRGDTINFGDLARLPAGSYVKVTQRRSYISAKPKNRATLRALGLRGIGMERVHQATPELSGMLRKVSHMVDMSRVDQGDGIRSRSKVIAQRSAGNRRSKEDGV
ncbi:MAG: 50S ribosomal protein L30 [Actinobacteria bacterium]|nr:50S ribosomal protein L30 [Actinomycetota bacterium]MCL5446587.1 50S ribosomal protein L30 [Actinomycetota bacterium]